MKKNLILRGFVVMLLLLSFLSTALAIKQNKDIKKYSNEKAQLEKELEKLLKQVGENSNEINTLKSKIENLNSSN